MSSTKNYRQQLWQGAVVGLVMPALGMILYGYGWAIFFNRTLSYFLTEVFWGTAAYRSPILSIALLANLVPFFLALRKENYGFARGVLLAVFLYVPFVVYFKLTE